MFINALREWRPLQKPGVDKNKKKSAEDSRAGWILQILSRLSQAERPHEDMSNIRTMQVLIKYLDKVKDPIPRAGRILARLSKYDY